MTLNEKFKEVLINPIWQMTMIDKQMEIADDFAIGFAEWAIKKEYHIDIWVKNNSTKELLEIYKKEKGL
jgi:hypothetical protein